MSSVIINAGDNNNTMAMNEKWGECIRKHLDTRGLTLRGAEAKAGGAPVGTTWMDWRNGKVPRDFYLAQSALLKVLGTEAAIECLKAGNLPIPNDWLENGTSQPEDLIRRYVQRCRGKIDREHMEASIRKILDEELKESEE